MGSLWLTSFFCKTKPQNILSFSRIKNIYMTKDFFIPKKKSIFSVFLSKTKIIPYFGIYSSGIGYIFIKIKKKYPVYGETQLKRSISHYDLEDTKFKWSVFFKFLIPEILYLIGAICSAFIVAILNIKIPLYLGEIVNILTLFTSETSLDFWDNIKDPVTNLIFSYGFQGLFTTAYIAILSSVGERLASNLRKSLFMSIILQDVLFFDSRRSGEIVNRLTSDVQDFKSSFKQCISQGLKSSTQVCGSVGALLFLSPKLTGVMLVVVPLVVGAGSLIGTTLRHLSRKASDQNAKATAVADEAICNVRTVKAFAMEEKEIELYNYEIDMACQSYKNLGYGIAIFQGLSNFALNGIVLGVLYTGGLLMSRQEVTAGDLMSFLVATQTIQRSLAQLSMLYGSAVRGYNAGARVLEYIDLQPKLLSGSGICPRPVHGGISVAFNDINFHYPSRSDQQVLSNLSFTVPRGKVVAVCGESGAGKSTLVTLLERFYDPQSGAIYIEGHDLTDVDIICLRGRLIGLINQEPQLFHTTVRENIRYGRPEASDREVMEAAKLANAHGFITEFPAGYDTVVGERGTAISGGQKQRVAIARALLKNPALLILDEATSALDAESEHQVQEALERVMKGRTVIVIAHRLSTIRDADSIVLLSKGKLVEKGNHSELMRRRGAYWKLVQRQSVDGAK